MLSGRCSKRFDRTESLRLHGRNKVLLTVEVNIKDHFQTD